MEESEEQEEKIWMKIFNFALSFRQLGDVAVYCILWFFRIECIPQEVLNKIRDKPITHNMTRDNECVMDGSYCIAFIEYIIAEKLC